MIDLAIMGISKFIDMKEYNFIYRFGNQFKAVSSLDEQNPKHLWGVQLPSGLVVALRCGYDFIDCFFADWEIVKDFAYQMELNGKHGSLPSIKFLKKIFDGKNEDVKLLDEITEYLSKFGIEADGTFGALWCKDITKLKDAAAFDLSRFDVDWHYFRTTGNYIRIAMVFN